MSTKKGFQEIIDFLTKNKNLKVEAILDQAKEMCSGKAGGGSRGDTWLKDDSGKAVAIKGYADGMWKPVVGKDAVAFSTKTGTGHGFNVDSKAGLKAWHARNKKATDLEKEMIAKLKSGEVKDVPAYMESIEKQVAAIKATPCVLDPVEGFKTKEEVIAHLQKQGIKVAA